MLGSDDLSGIGWAGDVSRNRNKVGRAVTLVSRRHVLFPAHWAITPGDRVQFMNADGAVFSYQVTDTAGTYRDTGNPSDLSIATLDERVDQSIREFPIGRREGIDYVDLELIVYGKYGRVGTNRLPTYWYDAFDVGTWRYSTTTAGPVGTAMSESGDSGSPTFVRINGELVVVGIRWLQTVDTWAPAFLEQLQDVAASDGESIRVGGSQPRCVADLTNDGMLRIDDVVAFLSSFGAQDDVADFAATFGVWSLEDVLAFLAAFEDGC
ncbi:MAG: hypothetical protein CMJ31_12800 [Phycisphaerae bacterium]|nr:hypothetical protein [Phycisphaerae bacterium]